MADSESTGTGEIIGYGRELQEITGAIEQVGSGALSHVAIISRPMSGRTTIIAELKRRYGDRVYYLPFNDVITPSTLPDFSTIPSDIILVDNCQYLATMRIGGFDVLNTFLHALIGSKKLFITTWNTYGWQYLSSVMEIDAYFPTAVVLDTMDTPVLKQVIMSRYKHGAIRFIDEGTTDRSMVYSVIHRTIRVPFTTTDISLPGIKLNFAVMRFGLSKKRRVQVALEDMIFEKINRIANGNPGVAVLIWEKSLKDNTIRLSDVSEVSCTIDLDINESFILSIILSMESLHHTDLSAIAGSEMDIERVLYRLVQHGLVTDIDGYYSVPPLLMACVVEYLTKTRRLWT